MLLMAWTAPAQTTLTNIAEIHSLPRSVAAHGLPVKVRGVITMAYNKLFNDFVLQESDKAIYVNTTMAAVGGSLMVGTGQPKIWKRGMLVELQGVTAAGDFAPVIIPQHITILGTGAPPAAVNVTLPQLLTGVFDCQMVALKGVVQRVEKFGEDNPGYQLDLLVATEGGGHFSAVALDSAGFEIEQLVGALVRLRGCALPFYNSRGELLGVHVYMTDRSDLDVLRPPLADAFSTPIVKLEDLNPFSATSPRLLRQRVQGVVTLSQPGEFFYVQSGDRAVRVTTKQPEPLTVGDLIEAVGFAEVSQYYAELHEAVFRKTGSAVPPAPVSLNWELATQAPKPAHELETPDFDGRLVSLAGRLKNIEAIPGQPTRLYLDHEGHTIVASFGNGVPAGDTENLRLGSDLVVTGVCVMSLATTWPALTVGSPTGFRILLRSPADITVIHAASWWTATRLLGALAGMVLVLSLVLAWAGLLHRTVAKQAARLVAEQQSKHDAEVEFKATLRERNRLAADLHDTLEQDLTGATYQLEAVRVFLGDKHTEAAKCNEFAHELLNRSRDDLRRSLWALRAGILDGRAFDDALRELAQRTGQTSGVACSCQIETDGTRVPEFEANHLLMVAQEAITNAIKHAGAKSISITGKIESKKISFTVTDDGKGFDPQTLPGPKQGHFGLLGMRERLRAMGGTIKIRSKPGENTQIEVHIPLNPLAISS